MKKYRISWQITCTPCMADELTVEAETEEEAESKASEIIDKIVDEAAIGDILEWGYEIDSCQEEKANDE